MQNGSVLCVCRFGALRRTGSDAEEGEEGLMEGLAHGNRSADSDMEMADGGPSTPVASLRQERGSTLSPRSSSALDRSKSNPYV